MNQCNMSSSIKFGFRGYGVSRGMEKKLSPLNLIKELIIREACGVIAILDANDEMI